MKFCYLLGYPVEHSLSPLMHNTAFQKLNLKIKYELLSVKPEKLRTAAESLRNSNVKGANVTIPHKITILPFIDIIDDLAANIGAVNTINNQDGLLKGYNTDGLGAIKAITNKYGSINGTDVLLLGAGGAARAVGFSIVNKVKKLTILNRNLLKAESLVKSLKKYGNSEVSAEKLDNVGNLLNVSDILINATPVGMYPDMESSPIGNNTIPSTLFVFDLVYNPIKTRLLLDAEAAGAIFLGGADMLVYQGVESFKIWTGLNPDESLMLKLVKNQLEKGEA
ncbi:shikimate dehydrogenase [Candidatus Bathyarchaeota archaeon]|nr:shikimate dehydrogenase [Candidatus Bathyarchaeota archaeon]